MLTKQRMWTSLILSVAIAATPVVVDEAPRIKHVPMNVITVNPADLFSGALSVEYERVVAPWLGISAGVSAWTFRGVFLPNGEPTFFGISPELGLRFHVLNFAPGGFWLGPTASVGALFERVDGPLTRNWSWGLSLAAGYNFIIENLVVLQLGGSSGFIDYGELIVWSPRLRIAVGFAF